MIKFEWFNNMKSRMKGGFRIRFQENARGKFLCVTLLEMP